MNAALRSHSPAFAHPGHAGSESTHGAIARAWMVAEVKLQPSQLFLHLAACKSIQLGRTMAHEQHMMQGKSSASSLCRGVHRAAYMMFHTDNLMVTCVLLCRRGTLC